MKVHYIQPFALDKNIGKAYNEACAMIPSSNDWICITDQDVMFLEPHTKALIHEIAATGDCELYVAMTNRLKNPHQLHGCKISDDPNIRNHIQIAKERREQCGTQVVEYPHITAGMLMLFPKYVWEVTPFAEGIYGDVTFDSHFGDCIRHKRGKVGLMTGVYVFHLYRFGQDNPGERIEHLR